MDIIFAVLVPVLIILLISVPFRYYPVENLKPINLSGKTIFVSDIHLKEKNNKINLEETENLVIVGDLFLRPYVFESWAGAGKEELKNEIRTGKCVKIKKGFCKALEYFPNTPKKVYYLSSHRQHDPAYLTNFSFTCNQTEVYGAGKIALFQIDETSVIAHHGHYIALGSAVVSIIARALNHPLILEKNWKKKTKINKNFWLIAGHSHIPAIDYENKVANTGTWHNLLRIKPEKRYLIIENNKVTFKIAE